MLRHLDEQDAANQVKYAVHSVYREGKHITRDMGGTASTGEFADAVIAAMESPPGANRPPRKPIRSRYLRNFRKKCRPSRNRTASPAVELSSSFYKVVRMGRLPGRCSGVFGNHRLANRALWNS